MPLMNFSNYWKVNWFIGKAEVCLGHELRKINKNGQTWTAMRNENSKGGRRLDKKDSRAEKPWRVALIRLWVCRCREW